MATQDQLIEQLRERYSSAEAREAVLAIHLFGIEFAEQLEGHSVYAHSVYAIAEHATGHRSFGTEIRKGMRLAAHVMLRKAL